MPRKEKNKPLTIEEKFMITKLIAKNYIKGGLLGSKHANEILKQHLNYQITPPTYNNLIRSIVRMGFRQLEEFLEKNTEKKINPIKNRQERILRTPMIQCREWMSQAHAETFFKFISNYYQLQVVCISVAEAESLYFQFNSLIKNSEQKDTIISEKRRIKQNLRIEKQIAENKKRSNKHYQQGEVKQLLKKKEQKRSDIKNI